ncbi:hypothetical protein [Candidatus Clavichlamydia salmonicola]|uniref:hypothetical protein n=1 Tax=Candidatus Clavichlamydia salmonicola TaxID=469812 RepID=UPI001890D5E0|nr:hypothetical protein [Candidatus Clavichlamydia salmonicola]
MDCEALLHSVSNKTQMFPLEIMDLGPVLWSPYNDILNASYDLKKHYLGSMLYRLTDSNTTILVKTVDCLKEGVFYVANHIFVKLLKH